MPNTEITKVNQFSITHIVQVPCDSVFLNLLPQTCTIKRPYDVYEGVKNVNEYGEVVMTYPVAQTIGTDIPVRIAPLRQRGELGFKVRTQGGQVFATYRLFMCPEIDIRENDSIIVGTREYQVLLIDELYNSTVHHHKEVLCRRLDFT